MRRLADVRRFVLPLALLASVAAGCAGPNGSAPFGPPPGSQLSNAAAPSFTVYTAGQTPGFPPGAAPEDIVPGKGGTMWFTDPGTAAIGRISANGTFTEFRQGLASGAQPYTLVAAPNGDLWFSDYRGVAIGRITPAGKIVEYESTQQPSGDSAAGIVIGSDGKPWFITFGPVPLLGHLTSQGKISLVRLPIDLSPDGTLASDASGNLWFIVTDKHQKADLMERTAQGVLVKRPMHMFHQELPCCPHRAPKRLVIGADGNPWFTTMDYGHRVSAATYLGTVAAGKVVLTKISHRGLSNVAYPSGIVASSAGMWLVGSDPLDPNGALWRTDAQGNQTPYDVPYNPIAVTVDRNGNPWFTAAWSGRPSQIVEAIVP
ncbi:MAG TPA: hypothetical protein VGF86_07400 [Candidatus Tumulicola sp.]|jgi:streptogramin lyase